MKPLLLIVDDEKTQREGLRAVLEEHYDIYIADDAASAIELLEAAIAANPGLAAFSESNETLEGGMDRLVKVMSVVTFQPEAEVMVQGECATFVCIVLDGELRDGSNRAYEAGSVVGSEGLFRANYQRQLKVTGGPTGGTLGILLYSELSRASLFDADVVHAF